MKFDALTIQHAATEKSKRAKIVADMLATLRVENLRPSEVLRSSLHAYVSGQKTTDDLLKEVKAKYAVRSENFAGG